MNFTHYLPETEKRIERLRQIIKGRPVAILVPGYSIIELEEKIGELDGLDICYASLNAAWAIEQNILGQIGKQLSIYECCAIPGLEEELMTTRQYLNRRRSNIYIATERSFKQDAWMQEQLQTYIKPLNDDRLLFFDVVDSFEDFNKVPSEEYPIHFPPLNTLSTLIYFSIIGGASLIVIFGADGGRLNTDDLYYRQTEMIHRPPSAEGNLLRDSRDFNRFVIPCINRVCELYNIKQPPIYNCSPQSRLTSLRIIDYNEAFRILHV